jgi:hypothetical protein
MGPEVHFRRTRDWAIAEGFSEEEAERIASANQDVDMTFPSRASFGNSTRHFPPTSWWWRWRYFREAVARRDLERLGWALHTVQDSAAHGLFGWTHTLQHLHLRHNPDVWALASPRLRARLERDTRRLLARYRAQAG